MCTLARGQCKRCQLTTLPCRRSVPRHRATLTPPPAVPGALNGASTPLAPLHPSALPAPAVPPPHVPAPHPTPLPRAPPQSVERGQLPRPLPPPRLALSLQRPHRWRPPCRARPGLTRQAAPPPPALAAAPARAVPPLSFSQRQSRPSAAQAAQRARAASRRSVSSAAIASSFARSRERTLCAFASSAAAAVHSTDCAAGSESAARMRSSLSERRACTTGCSSAARTLSS
eukprot:scaffold87057_cov24-Tisochrysis_lutea.AAC.7